MKKLYSLAIATLMASTAWGAEVTDIISPETVFLTASYAEQEASFNSTASYLITLKDEGSGPQFKAGGSSIVVKNSGGVVTKIEVTWGAKSNEGIQVYGSTSPYEASNCTISGTDLGVIDFVANSTSTLLVEGEWEYIGLTSTAVKGKACSFSSMSITWSTGGEVTIDPSKGLVINEVCGDDATTDGREDWAEIYNPTAAPLPLAGVTVTKVDEDAVATPLYTFAADTPTLQPGAYAMVTKGVEFTAGLSNTKNLSITLIGSTGATLDVFNKAQALTPNGNHYPGGSYSRIPDGTGAWASVANATYGAANDATPVAPAYVTYYPVTAAEQIYDGMQFVLVCTGDVVGDGVNYVMASDWGTTKDGSVYQLTTPGQIADGNVTFDSLKAAICTLVGNSDGNNTWAIQFGATNNYLNDSRFLACPAFKNMTYKKADDPAKGTRATLAFNADSTLELSYGDEAGGSIKFNPKDDGTSRFLNYDPTDKPDEHLAIRMYTAKLPDVDVITTVGSDNAAPVRYYDLQGRPVTSPRQGQVLIRVQGDNSSSLMLAR